MRPHARGLALAVLCAAAAVAAAAAAGPGVELSPLSAAAGQVRLAGGAVARQRRPPLVALPRHGVARGAAQQLALELRAYAPLAAGRRQHRGIEHSSILLHEHDTPRACCRPGAQRGADAACLPWSRAAIAEFRRGMTVCFTEALRQGKTLYVRPHLDDGTGQGSWRNGLLLRPSERYGGFSYTEIMLEPLADALRDALAISAAEQTIKPLPGRTRPAVYLALQGEMSATIVRYASEWAALVQPLRQRLLGASRFSSGGNATSARRGSRAAATGAPADIKLGIGLNFNRLDDSTSTSQRFDSSRFSWLLWQLGAGEARGSAPPLDVAGLARLLNGTGLLQFLGISAYAPYNLDADGSLALQQFENSAFQFARELQRLGIDLRALLAARRLEFHYSEFGIGGGASYAGTQVAATPAEVLARPFFGVYGPYRVTTDPWARPVNHRLRREFYSKALTWLADPSRTTFRLSGVFLWSMASWDVGAVHPESTSDEGSYRDPAVCRAIAAHNRAAAEAAAEGGQARAGAAGTADRPSAPPSVGARASTGQGASGAGASGSTGPRAELQPDGGRAPALVNAFAAAG